MNSVFDGKFWQLPAIGDAPRVKNTNRLELREHNDVFRFELGWQRQELTPGKVGLEIRLLKQDASSKLLDCIPCLASKVPNFYINLALRC